MKRSTIITATVLTLLGLLPLSGVEAGPIKKREVRQQQRIAKGIDSGELTGKETVKLEREQAKIEADRQKALADGKMTKREKSHLTREQNRASRHIYREKHDAQKQPAAN